jgi:uncharacterized membrane protein
MLWQLFIAVLALTLAAEALVARHPHFEVEKIFAFNAVYGFLACAVLILVARGIGLFVKRKDDYYDE